MAKTLDKESRLKLLRQSSPEIQELYGSEENGTVLSSVASKLGIADDASYSTFALTVGDIILGSHAKESLGQMLKDRMDMTDEQVAVAINDLRDFLAKIPEQKKAAVNTVIDLTNEKPAEATGNEAEERPAPERAAVKPLRTFAGDVEVSRAHSYGAFRSADNAVQSQDDEPTHRSSQDDIMRK